MIFFFDDNGECVSAVSGDYSDQTILDELIKRTKASCGATASASGEPADIKRVYLHDGAIHARDEAPTIHHKWDKSARAWIDPRPEAEKTAAQWAEIRTKRDELLNDTDWVTLRAFENDSPVPGPWRVYRQRLRDVTNQPDPFNITWPEPPKP